MFAISHAASATYSQAKMSNMCVYVKRIHAVNIEVDWFRVVEKGQHCYKTSSSITTQGQSKHFKQ